jgi:hypothetical protein
MLLSPVATGGLLLWNSVSKVGSNLTDIVTRNHSDLQNINTAAYTHLSGTNHTDLTDGGNSVLHYHATDRDLANASGTLLGAQFPALSGDVTTVAGALEATLATVNSNAGAFGDATHAVTITVNAKGLITAISAVSIIYPVISFNARTGAITLSAADVNAALVGSLAAIPQFTTAGAPAYTKGSAYFDTTLNKLRIGGVAAWETITSV